MKMFIPMFCLVTYVLAEPPVGDSYSSVRNPGHDHHDHGVDIQRSLPDQYGPPSFGARNLQTQHGSPRSRSNPSQTYGTPSQSYGVPAVRTPGQQYGVPSARLSQSYGVPRSQAQEYGVPALRSNSNDYLPSAKSLDHARSRVNSLSARTSGAYSAPELRSKPSEEYGLPSNNARSNLRSQFSAQTPSEQYGAPARSNENQGYSARNVKSSARISQSYGVPKAQSYSSQPLTSYGVPAARDADSYSQEYNSISESYGAPSQRDLSDTYGVPESRGLAQEYGVPSSRSSLNTNALVSSYPNAK
ncbi:hypothetical protein K1T71_013947 [Dendrolimus kikuchii]|uniref:Uncharacterized protein n=1 Tax=Dendrolimus kikuchii TaxID=765133 RepID=A0ACC1CG76_9NEOP|nr:hypothetical protein K1T71_013947 [Dendrolimus kikuchii]